MKTITIDNEPVIKKIESVNRVFIDLFYPIETNNDNTATLAMLKRMLSLYNKNYLNIPDFHNKLDSLYILGYSVGVCTFLEISYIKFSLALPKLGLLEDYSLHDVLSFFYDCIYNSCNDGKEFNNTLFEKELKYLKDKEEDFPKSVYEYTFNEYYKYIDKEEKFMVSHEKYMEYLKDTNPKKVYEFYKENVLNNNYKVFIYGGIDDEKEYSKEFKKIFKNDKKSSKKDYKFRNYFKTTKYEHKYEKTKYEQSVLYLNYSIKDMKESDEIYFYMLQLLLASKENDLIYNHLRVKNNLVYSSRVRPNRTFGIIDIVAYYNNYDYEKIIDLVNEIIFKLKEKDFYDYCVDKMIKASEYDFLYREDDPFADAVEEIELNICEDIPYKEKIEKVKNVKFEDFCEFLDRFTLSKTYLFESGDKND